MKTIILIAILICLTILSAFSQRRSGGLHDPIIGNKQVSPDLLLSGIDSLQQITFISMDSISYNFALPHVKHFKKSFPFDSNNLFGRLNESYTTENMPCYKPKGNFKMPVYYPDSTMNYTLLIK